MRASEGRKAPLASYLWPLVIVGLVVTSLIGAMASDRACRGSGERDPIGRPSRLSLAAHGQSVQLSTLAAEAWGGGGYMPEM